MISLDELNLSTRDLPSLPAVVEEIINLSDDSEINIEVLTNKIQRDPGISAQVLSLANSPFYGLQSQVSSLKEACIILGVHTLKNLAIATGIIKHFSNTKNSAIDIMDIWKHSIATAVAAKVLAAELGLDEDMAFTAGLLHDIGKIILDKVKNEKYQEVMLYKNKHDCFLIEAEKNVLGITHADVGEYVAIKWKLPEEIAIIIRDHHMLGDKNFNKLSALVHVADIISCGLLLSGKDKKVMPNLNENALGLLSLDMDMLTRCLPVIDSMNSVTGSILLTKH